MIGPRDHALIAMDAGHIQISALTQLRSQTKGTPPQKRGLGGVVCQECLHRLLSYILTVTYFEYYEALGLRPRQVV